jgi:hypothetical protein
MNSKDSNTQDTTTLEPNILTGVHRLLVTIGRQSDFLMRCITKAKAVLMSLGQYSFSTLYK